MDSADGLAEEDVLDGGRVGRLESRQQEQQPAEASSFGLVLLRDVFLEHQLRLVLQFLNQRHLA